MLLPDDLALAEEAAVAAGACAGRYFGGMVDVREKSAPGDVVSLADIEAEHVVRDLLQSKRPKDGILGEEGSHVDGSRRWLVDAIDGTLNFVRGDPFWCSAIALEDEDGGVVAAIHHVASGETFTAARGRGAFLNGQRLGPLRERPLSEAALATYLHPEDGRTATFQRVLDHIASPRARGSGSLELAWLAVARVDAWLQRNVHPWDLVPGALVVTEAGGACGSVPNAEGTWSYAANHAAARELLPLFQL